jgi:putative Ca2+/H+ antiporter (TMEM165/GDT1 family)
VDGFLTALGAVFVAELGDKTQLGILLATDRLRRPWPIFLGAAAALLTSTALATVVGGAAGAALPQGWLRLVGGLVFVVVGALTLWDLVRGGGDDEGELPLGHSARRVALAIYAAILLAEMGDKTQLVTAALAGTRDPWAAGAGAGLALVLSAGLAVLVGLGVTRLTPRTRRLIRGAGGVLFLGFGVWYLVEAAQPLS